MGVHPDNGGRDRSNDLIAIVEQMWRFIVREGVAKLSWRPGSRWLVDYRDVNDPSAIVREGDEHEWSRKGGRRDEDVGSHELTGVAPRKVRQACDGGCGCRRMYFATVD